MPFVTATRPEDRPDNPIAVFDALRPRDSSIRDLLLRQGDALRAYAEKSSTPDIAVELPTGGGKTLVGLLIAEWRRRAMDQRVAYLCPTKQLVRQTAQRAHAYGLDVVTLIGPQADWDEGDFSRFQRGRAVAIAGYSQVFNSNPRLSSAQTLILDDAHAAESSIADTWSVRARRGSALHTALSALFAPHLPPGFADQLLDGGRDPARSGGVQLVSPDALTSVATELAGLVTEHAEGSSRYAAQMLGPAIGRCLAFVDWSEILLRPFIPDTASHAPFASAEQRVYMSATLGSAGELQRAFGVPNIDAIGPDPSRDQDHGRRFFLFPHIVGSGQSDGFIRSAMSAAGRSLLIAPSDALLDEAIERIVPDEVAVVDKDAIAENLDAFATQTGAVLALANRYDGIDLPGETCRLVVLTGLPRGTHLQERFLADTLAAGRVLAQRVRTRIQQGAGRATRSARDFAAVIIRSEPLTDFLSRTETVRSMVPPLQAEIEFGLINSEVEGVDLFALLTAFWGQGEDWQDAERELARQAAAATREISPVDDALARSASKEVRCWQAIMRDDLPTAIQLAQQATDEMIGGDELRPYRAFWFYLASCWAHELAQGGQQGFEQQYLTLKTEAAGAAGPLRWTPQWLGETATEQASSDTRPARAGDELRRLGIRGGAFAQRLGELRGWLEGAEAVGYEQGIELLGRLLGFESIRPRGAGVPDGCWRADEELVICWEAKSEESEDGAISLDTVRQAASHLRWSERELGWSEAATKLCLVASPRRIVAPEATTAATPELRLVSPEEVLAVASRLEQALVAARASARGTDDAGLADVLRQAFDAHGLTNADLIDALAARPLEQDIQP